MRVRDLRQYISEITGVEYSIKELGTHREPFLGYAEGHFLNIEQFKGHIESSASFATNAEEQLFYEFVQNAYDAKADSLYFFANDKYLIVLNNGEPFYTDFDLTSDDNRKGQLYNFLTKGKSNKRGDDEQLGQFGQGSKLLYTLITDVSDGQLTDAELLVEAIYDQRKGPYLISWNSKEQLTNLLYGEPVWEFGQADDYKNNILVAKILYSYFPIAPGQELRLFSNKEAEEVINVFDQLVDPRRNLQYMSRGTALIIPLGKGKSAKIREENNLKRVRTRLGGFSALTAYQRHNSSKLKHIYVLNQEIEQSDVVSVVWQKQVGKSLQKYHLAFNPVFAQNGYVNFFKGLPILSTRHNLGFIIDSQCFQTDDSRQRLSNKDTVEMQLRDIFSELIIHLKEKKETNPEEFDKIYDAILASRLSVDEESAFIARPFTSIIKPFIEENIRTDMGTYEPSSKVFLKILNNKFEIPLGTLGVNDKSWVDPNIVSSLSKFGIELKSMNLRIVISNANSTKLGEWIKSMEDKDYAVFQKECVDYINIDQLVNVKLFRSNENKLYSYSDLNTSGQIYFNIDNNLSFNGLEYIPVKFSNYSDYNNVYPKILLSKIEAGLEAFKGNATLLDTVSNLLIYIVNEDKSLANKVLDLNLFKNQQGKYVALKELFYKVPSDSYLFDEFQVSGYLPESLKKTGWLLDFDTNIDKTWQWVVDHIDNIIKLEDWDSMSSCYLDDIISIYKKVPSTKTRLPIKNLYFNSEGLPTTDVHLLLKKGDSLSSEEYESLQLAFPDIELLPYKFYSKLNSLPFSLESITASDLIDENTVVEVDTLSILSKLITNFFSTFYFEEEEEGFAVKRLNYGRNYTNNDLNESLKSAIAKKGFHHIPQELQRAFISKLNSSEYDLANNTDLIKSLIQRVDPESLFDIFSLVERCNEEILKEYYGRLPYITIDQEISERDIKWRIIELAIKRTTETLNFKNLVFSKIRHNTVPLPQSIVESNVKINDYEYDLYKLDKSFKVSNSNIDSFLQCLPSSKRDYFKKEFYQDKTTAIAASNLFSSICTQYQKVEYFFDNYRNRIPSIIIAELSLYQLEFCLDYALKNQIPVQRFKPQSAIGLKDVLDLALLRNFVGFDKYYTVQGFDNENQIYAEEDILLPQEKLPLGLFTWLKNNDNGEHIFSNLRKSSETQLVFRRCIKDNTNFTGVLTLNNDVKTRNTLNWLLSRQINCSKDSIIYGNLRHFIDKLPDGFNGMPFFKYTGKVEKDEETRDSKPKFQFCLYEKDSPFLKGVGVEFCNCLASDAGLQQFIRNHSLYEYPGEFIIYRHQLKNAPVWNVRHGFVNGNYIEFDYPNYQRWKQLQESEGVTLYTCPTPIGVTLSIFNGTDEIFSIKRKNAECGNNPVTKQVVVQYPNADNLSKMKTVEKYSKGISWLKDPLIVLLGLYVNETDELQKIADEQGMELMNVIDIAKNTLSGNTLDAQTFTTIQQRPQIYQALAGNFEPETLEKIGENATAVDALLNSFSSDELKSLSSLSSESISTLSGMSKDEIEELLKNADKFKLWLRQEEMANDNGAMDAYYNLLDEFELSQEQLNEHIESINGIYEQLGSEGWEKFINNRDSLVDIVHNFTDEELRQIAENEENLREFFKELQEKDLDDRSSNINSIIGYIGELIYEQYLVNNQINYEYSADKGEGSYDFIVYSSFGKASYVDVKTTLETLKDGHSPMYIHKSQDDFLKNNPDKIYRFIRVSLSDLENDLVREYEELSEIYNIEEDPRDPQNISLKKACQDIAKKYWHMADISDFEEASPSYRIQFVNI